MFEGRTNLRLVVDRIDFRFLSMSQQVALTQNVALKWITKALAELFFKQMSQDTEIIKEETTKDEQAAVTNQKLDEQTISGKHPVAF